MRPALLLLFVLIATGIHSQNFYQKIIGTNKNIEILKVQATADGGSVSIGTIDDLGNENMLLLKLDVNAEVMWGKTIDYNSIDMGRFIIVDGNGNYVLGGETVNPDQNKDMLITKTDPAGKTLWSRKIGGSKEEELTGILTTKDGGYLVIAHTMSYGSGMHDLYIIKLNTAGDITWEKVIGSTGSEIPYSAIQLSNEEFVITGLASGGLGAADILFVKLDKNGNLLLNKNIGATSNEFGSTIILKNDNTGFAIQGSYTNPVSAKSTSFLLFTDSTGTPGPTTFIQGINNHQLFDLISTDNGYLFTGYSLGKNRDLFLGKVDKHGALNWFKQYGSTGDERGTNIFRRPDKSIVCIGSTNSFNQNSNGIYALAVDTLGGSPCLENKDYTLILESVSYTTATVNLNVISPVSSAVPVTAVVADYSLTALTICPIDKFRKIIYDKRGSLATKMSFSHTRGLIVSGTTQNYATIPSFMLCEMDMRGNPKWMHVFSSQDKNESIICTSMDRTADKGYILCGYRDYPYDTDGIIIKTDSLGNIIWSKKYGGGNFVFLKGIKTTSYGDFVVIGSTVNGDSVTGPTDRSFVLKLSKSGTVLWDKTFNLENIGCRPLSLALTKKNEIVFIGEINIGGSGNFLSYLCKMDENGNVVFIKKINEYSNMAKDIHVADNNDLLLCGIQWGGPNTSPGWTTRTDSLGNPLWSKSYMFSVFPSPNSHYAYATFNRLMENSDHSIAVIGESPFPSMWEGTPVYFKLGGATGDVIFSQIFGPGGEDVGADLVENTDKANTLLIASNSYNERQILGGKYKKNTLIVKNDYCDALPNSIVHIQNSAYSVSSASMAIEPSVNVLSDISLVTSDLPLSLGTFAIPVTFDSYVVNKGKDSILFHANVPNKSTVKWDFGDGTSSTLLEPVHYYKSGGTYTVCLTYFGACDNSVNCSAVKVDPIHVDIQKNAADHAFKLFPNPAIHSVDISFGKNYKTISVCLYTAEGVKLSDYHFSATDLIHLDLKAFSAGFYFVHITTDSEQKVLKMIKN